MNSEVTNESSAGHNFSEMDSNKSTKSTTSPKWAEKMTLPEMAEAIWSKAKITQENLKNIDRPYRDLLAEALMEKYK